MGYIIADLIFATGAVADDVLYDVCCGAGVWALALAPLVRSVWGFERDEHAVADAERLQPLLARECEIAVREGRMTVAETRMLLRFYQAELGGYTYLEADS